MLYICIYIIYVFKYILHLTDLDRSDHVQCLLLYFCVNNGHFPWFILFTNYQQNFVLLFCIRLYYEFFCNGKQVRNMVSALFFFLYILYDLYLRLILLTINFCIIKYCVGFIILFAFLWIYYHSFFFLGTYLFDFSIK